MLKGNNKSSVNNDKLQIYTLGRFEILKHNGDTFDAALRSNKLWNLFKYLLVNKDRALPAETILENLFPDEEYENPKSNVQNLIYRLRKLLVSEGIFNESKNNILFTNGCYKLDINNDIFLDIIYFEELVNKARSIKKDNIQEAINLYRKALDIYKGNFLPELVYEDWVVSRRNYYNKLFIQSVIELADLYKQDDLYDSILEICEKAILIEPYEEELYICYMETLVKKGKVREAQKHYEQTTSFFYKQFGIKPTADMQKLYQMIKPDYSKENKVVNIWENNKGAFCCDYGIFTSILVLEKRRSERTGKPVCPVAISIKDDIEMNLKFKECLISTLRKGDVVSESENKLLVMLPDIEFNQVKYVMDRVIKLFLQENNLDSIDIHIKPFTI